MRLLIEEQQMVSAFTLVPRLAQCCLRQCLLLTW